MLVGGLIGALASSILTFELIHILENPSYQPVCNLNPIFSCASVTTSDQAHAFGFPNEFLGIAGYVAVATIGAGILAGASYKRWFWRALNIGLVLAVAFVTWLQFQTMYRIGALCLFCMVVWAVTLPMFWYTLLYSLKEGHIPSPKKLNKLILFAQRHHGDILLAWFLLLVVLIGKRFWYYWSTLF